MSMIVSILESFLGNSITHYEKNNQIQFDCPMCSEEKGLPNGDGKGNLAVNYKKGVFKCWSCWERNNMHGSIIKLIKKYGTPQNLKDYLLITPKSEVTKVESIDNIVTLTLPKGFKYFSKSTNNDNGFKDAYKYIKSRGITDLILNKYNIGFTIEGSKKNRIIIPSYDIDGRLNYYVSRAFYGWVKPKYLNPDARKEDIIFNEYMINWDFPIYIVEGAFDHIVTPNSIPLLGKFISDKLLLTLILKAKNKIIIVLDGGEEERADGILLYNKLNILNLYGKIRIVNLINGDDLSKIYQDNGNKMIIKFLRNKYKIMESRV